MLTQPTLQTLRRLKLTGMADAFEQQLAQPAHAELSFEERFGLLVDRELTSRDNRRLSRTTPWAIRHWRMPSWIWFCSKRTIFRSMANR